MAPGTNSPKGKASGSVSADFKDGGAEEQRSRARQRRSARFICFVRISSCSARSKSSRLL